MNKKILIGLGILAVAGISFYMWKKNKSSSNSIDWKKTDAEIAKEFGLDLEQVVEMRKKAEGKSNAVGRVRRFGRVGRVPVAQYINVVPVGGGSQMMVTREMEDKLNNK